MGREDREGEGEGEGATERRRIIEGEETARDRSSGGPHWALGRLRVRVSGRSSASQHHKPVAIKQMSSAAVSHSRPSSLPA